MPTDFPHHYSTSKTLLQINNRKNKISKSLLQKKSSIILSKFTEKEIKI